MFRLEYEDSPERGRHEFQVVDTESGAMTSAYISYRYLEKATTHQVLSLAAGMFKRLLEDGQWPGE